MTPPASSNATATATGRGRSRGRTAVVLALVALALLGFFLALPEPGDERVAPPAEGFVVRDVRVFDGEQLLPRATVVVRAGRIAAVKADPTTASTDDTAGLPVIDGTGLTLLPGLIDAHVHVWGNALAETLNFGVTTVLDMFSEPVAAQNLRRTRDALSPRAHADLFSAGYLATAPGGHGTQFGLPVPTLTTPAEAPAWVDARLAEGSDYIKIVYEPRDANGLGPPFPSIDRDTLAALVQATQARGRLAVVHVSRRTPALDVAAAGADGLVHVPADRVRDDGLARQLRERGMFVTPTLAVLASLAGRGPDGTPTEGERLAADPALRPFLTPDQRQGLGRSFGSRVSAFQFEAALATVAELHAAGVELMAGSDAPNPGTAHGASLHHELELLVRAGLTPTEALRAATATPARRFGLSDRGRIAPGQRADLLLVRGDPTADITATRQIERVWKNGAPVQRQRYPETP